MNHLIENEVLTFLDWERLKSIRINSDMVLAFVISMLPRKGPRAFDGFIRSLRATEGQQFIADYLSAEINHQDARQADNQFYVEPSATPSDNFIVQSLDREKFAFTGLEPITKNKATEILDQGQTYKLTSETRGQAVIINQERNREGAKHDGRELKQLFHSLYFDVKKYTDLTAKEIQDKIIEISRADHSASDAFVLVCMSHGVNGYILGVDNVGVDVDFIAETIGSCPTLINKPKILMFQCCRVNEEVQKLLKPDARDSLTTDYHISMPLKENARLEDDASLRAIAEMGNSGMRRVKSTDGRDARDPGPGGSIEKFTDMFIVYSTLQGFYSYRNEGLGSWFIRYFVYVCSNEAHREDFISIIQRTGALLKLKMAAIYEESAVELVMRGVTKKFMFFPKYPEDSQQGNYE
jgi:caspase-like apoptosis-related cysteine protease